MHVDHSVGSMWFCRVGLCTHVSLYVRVCACVSMCPCLCLSVSLSLSLCVCVCVCVCVCGIIRLCGFPLHSFFFSFSRESRTVSVPLIPLCCLCSIALVIFCTQQPGIGTKVLSAVGLVSKPKKARASGHEGIKPKHRDGGPQADLAKLILEDEGDRFT